MTLGCQQTDLTKKTKTPMPFIIQWKIIKIQTKTSLPYSKATKLLTLKRLDPIVPKGKARIGEWM